MPVAFRDFAKEIQEKGYTVVQTIRGHYLVRDRKGNLVGTFAVGHGRNKGLVLDCYVSKIRKALK
jgi:hypothetical protein